MLLFIQIALNLKNKILLNKKETYLLILSSVTYLLQNKPPNIPMSVKRVHKEIGNKHQQKQKFHHLVNKNYANFQWIQANYSARLYAKHLDVSNVQNSRSWNIRLNSFKIWITFLYKMVKRLIVVVIKYGRNEKNNFVHSGHCVDQSWFKLFRYVIGRQYWKSLKT